MVRHYRFSPSHTSVFVLLTVLLSLGFVKNGWPQTLQVPSATTSASAAPASVNQKSSATGTFVVAPTLPVSGTPSSVATGDLNGDGTLDLVVADSTNNKVSVLLGQGKGKFSTAVDYIVGKQPSFVTIADINGDSKLDLIVANEADGTVSILLGNGDGTFAKPVTYAAAADPSYLVVADFNAHSKPDLAIVGKSSGAIAVLLNDGTGNFGKPVLYALGRPILSLAVGNFLESGIKGLALGDGDGNVAILVGRGDRGFRTASLIPVGSAPISSITVGNFGGEQKADLAVTQSGTKLVTILLGNGDGTFRVSSQYPVGGNPSSVATADVNNDNIPDLITVNQSANSFSILLGAGDGTFKPSLDFVAGNSPSSLALGDFNGDGSIDLAIANVADKSISLAFGNGNGTFNAARAFTVDLDRKSLAAGDLDGDGRPDLVVTNFCGTDAACKSNGTASVLLGVGEGTYKLAGSYPLGQGPLSVSLADVNGDQKLDLVAVNRGDKSVSVLLGNGDGSFQSALTYPLSNSPTALVTGNFNNDGKLDLAIAADCGSGACAQPGEVIILLGNSDGSFKTAGSYPVGYSPSSLAAGDLNGDSKVDLVVGNACGEDGSCQSKGTATVLLGDGKGAFRSAGDLPLGNIPSSIALGDLNGDGALDIVVSYRADSKIGVLMGNGDATFKPRVDYAVGIAPSAVIISDFNGDGKRDVAIANFKDSKISVLLGNGDGTLQPATHYATGPGPEALIAIDASKTGHADLVSANGNGGLLPQGSDITVLRNAVIGEGSNPATVTITCTGCNGGSTTYGTQLMFTGTVVGNFGSPTGTVDITDNGKSIDTACDSVALVATGDGKTSTGSCTTKLLTGGMHSNIIATYSGDGTYAGGPSMPLPTQTVIRFTPVFETIIQSDNPSSYGDTLTFQVTLDGAPGAAAPTGNVVFKDGAAILCTSPLVPNGSNGQASCVNPGPGNNPPPLNQGPHSIVASYNDDINYAPAQDSSAFAQQVNPASTKFSGLTGSQTIPYGTASINLSGTISATGNNGPVYPPKGESVTVIIAGNMGAPQIGDSGGFSLTFTTSSISASNSAYPITYSYNTSNSDPNFTSATDNSTSLTVNKATTTISPFTSSPTTSTYGQAVMLSATVNPQISGIPSGTMDFTDAGNAIPSCGGVTVVSGVAMCTTKGLSGGTHTMILARYSGDDNFLGTVSQPLNPPQQVKPDTTSVALVAVPPTSTYGETVTFTATVTTGNGESAVGTVEFTDNGTDILNCNAVLVMNNVATCMTNTLIPTQAPHAIVATFKPDNPMNLNSNSMSIQYTVTAATTNTVLTADPAQGAVYKQPITFMAMVTVTSQGGGNPTGVVNFTDAVDGTLCSNVAVAPMGNGSVATCVVGLSVSSAHKIDAKFTGLPNFAISEATINTYPVGQAGSTVTVSSGTAPSNVNEYVLFTAMPAGQFGGSPTGQVMFMSSVGAIPECPSPQPLMNGQAMCTTRSLPFGNPSVIATYLGDGNFKKSPAFSLPQEVDKTATTISVTANPNPSVFQQDVSFLISVAPQFSLPTKIMGTVSLSVDSVPLLGCQSRPVIPADNGVGQATCDTTGIPPGMSEMVTTAYSGDSNFLSNSTISPQEVGDFTLQVTTTQGISAAKDSNNNYVVTVAQGYTNLQQSNSPTQPQTVTVATNSLYGYINSVNLSCSVTAVGQITQNLPTCSFATSPVKATDTTTITIGAGSSPAGNYTVTITGSDATHIPLSHSQTFTLLIADTTAPALGVTPGPTGSSTAVSLSGSSSTSVTLSCQSPPPGVTCTFNPASVVLTPGPPVSSTITVTASLHGNLIKAPNKIFATLWFGIPAVVWIGLLPRRKSSLRGLLRTILMVVVVYILLQVIGCGGGSFNRTQAPPTGGNSYNLVVVGTDANGVESSAVVPISVLNAGQ